jgi:thiosulfate/3-mercaptopyruvate sulfurtransferase
MGHHNVAVLDGGFPAWEKAELPIEKALGYFGKSGNFIAKYNANCMNDFNDVFDTIDNDNILVLDARSENRFNGKEPEPREGLRGGHIPNSINLPYSKLIENNKMKSKEKLKSIFSNLVDKDSELIFSCGSGITACILALGAEIAGFNNKSVYDGSWTEWGTLSDI